MLLYLIFHFFNKEYGLQKDNAEQVPKTCLTLMDRSVLLREGLGRTPKHSLFFRGLFASLLIQLWTTSKLKVMQNKHVYIKKYEQN